MSFVHHVTACAIVVQGLIQLVLLWNGERGSFAPGLETQPEFPGQSRNGLQVFFKEASPACGWEKPLLYSRFIVILE